MRTASADRELGDGEGRAHPMQGLNPEQGCLANVWLRGVGAGAAQQDGRWLNAFTKNLAKPN